MNKKILLSISAIVAIVAVAAVATTAFFPIRKQRPETLSRLEQSKWRLIG